MNVDRLRFSIRDRKFPILLIADDGWVEHVKTAAEIAK
jgi:hypothetical protein